MGLILCQFSPDGAAARIRSPTSAQAQAAIAWTTVLSEAVSGSSEKLPGGSICMFFTSTGNPPRQPRALLVAKFLGSRLVP